MNVPTRLAQIAEQKRKALQAKQSLPLPTLREFIIGAWQNVLHPSEPLETEGAWYIDLICEWLTVLTVGTAIRMNDRDLADKLLAPYDLIIEDLSEELIKARQLLINISPRCSKSTIVTVCWACWEWLVMPWLTYMCMSYDQSLASDHNDDRRKIIQSNWYQQLAGGMLLSSSKNRVTEFQNQAQGQMVGRGLNAGVTGGGGMRLIFDDANDPNKVESDAVRSRASKAFKDYSITRRNNPRLAVVVNVQQRTHDRDISGEVLDNPEGWISVIIPMEAEQHERIEFPLSKRVIERAPGDLMHPERFDAEICSSLKKQPWIWAGRYQQRPQISGGGIFKIRNWRLYAELPNLDRTILSVDAAFKKTDTSDFVAIGVIGQLLNVRTVLDLEGNDIPEHQYYLPYRWKAQAGITDTENAIKATAQRYPQAFIKLIEDKANGSAIVERLERIMHGITAYSPGSNSKEARAAAAQPVQFRGDVCLPIADWAKPALQSMGVQTITIGEWWDLYPPAHESNAEHAPVEDWVKDLIDEAALFPSAANDDQVDMLVQAINWLESQPVPSGWSGFSSESI